MAVLFEIMLDKNAFMHSPAQNVVLGANGSRNPEKGSKPLAAADQKAKATGTYVPAKWAAHVDTQVPLAHSNNDCSHLLTQSLILSLTNLLIHKFIHELTYSDTYSLSTNTSSLRARWRNTSSTL